MAGMKDRCPNEGGASGPGWLTTEPMGAGRTEAGRERASEREGGRCGRFGAAIPEMAKGFCLGN